MTELDNQLIMAAENNDLDSVKDLLSKGADVNGDEGTPLWEAIDYDNIPMAKFLIENGADVNAGGGRPLLRTIYNDNVPMAELLIENGAEVYDHILYRAEKNGHTAMVELLNNELRKSK